MPRRTKEDAQKTRERIFASALVLFVKKGYERTTFSDIAARLKMTKGAIYWHFESKEALLVALVHKMLERFRQRMSNLGTESGLTFPVVARAMVENAAQIVEDPEASSFFLLMHTQVRWGADSMAKMREHLLSSQTDGPYHSFIKAVKNDLAAGRVREGVDPTMVASASIAIWSGLVRSKIEKFLQCDLSGTLRQSYEAIWRDIAAGDARESDI